MTSLDILVVIHKWQERLGLAHWTFGVATNQPSSEKHDMEIVMTPIRQHAAIRIHPRCFEYSPKKVETLIIHELLHPLFQPIQKEFERCVESNKDREYHTDAVETCVDHLSKVLINIS